MTQLTRGDDAPVIDLDSAAADAYRMGYRRFADFGDGLTEEEQNEHPPTTSHVKESATWANSTHPRLRCMAGASDPTGKGTWTGHRPVVVLRAHEVDDEPAPGTVADSRHIADLLVDWWDRGAYDAMEGADMEPYTDEITAV
jgi:hypothetical protein